MTLDLARWEKTAAALLAENERRKEAGLGPGQTLKCLHPASARVLYNAALATRARRIIEVGTSAGYSTLWLGRAAALNGGTVTSVEIKADLAEMARRNFKAAGLDDYVNVNVGDALDCLPAICRENTYDLAFIDAVKGEYVRYFDLLWPHISARGSVIADNIISHAKELSAYLDRVRGLGDGTTTTLAVGNGLEWTVKL